MHFSGQNGKGAGNSIAGVGVNFGQQVIYKMKRRVYEGPNYLSARELMFTKISAT
jgi:hypothetical protein